MPIGDVNPVPLYAGTKLHSKVGDSQADSDKGNCSVYIIIVLIVCACYCCV